MLEPRAPLPPKPRPSRVGPRLRRAPSLVAPPFTVAPHSEIHSGENMSGEVRAPPSFSSASSCKTGGLPSIVASHSKIQSGEIRALPSFFGTSSCKTGVLPPSLYADEPSFAQTGRRCCAESMLQWCVSYVSYACCKCFIRRSNSCTNHQFTSSRERFLADSLVGSPDPEYSYNRCTRSLYGCTRLQMKFRAIVGPSSYLLSTIPSSSSTCTISALVGLAD
jgi:hypothetical protein